MSTKQMTIVYPLDVAKRITKTYLGNRSENPEALRKVIAGLSTDYSFSIAAMGMVVRKNTRVEQRLFDACIVVLEQKTDLQDQVDAIAAELNTGTLLEGDDDIVGNFDVMGSCTEPDDYERAQDGYSYFANSLEVEWVTDDRGLYKGANILVAFGGPTVWVNTRKQIVEGAWWNESYSAAYNYDAYDLHGVGAELYPN